MKISKEKAEENRTALLVAASRLFREHGIDGVGVAEISKEAGLTHGALYAHFPSKDALAAEALAESFERGLANMRSGEGENALSTYLDYYLAPAQRDNLAGGCALAASASEIGRRDAMVSASFTTGFLGMADTVEAALGDASGTAKGRERALATVASMIGGVAMSRATAKSNPELADEILRAVRSMLASHIAG